MPCSHVLSMTEEAKFQMNALIMHNIQDEVGGQKTVSFLSLNLRQCAPFHAKKRDFLQLQRYKKTQQVDYQKLTIRI